MELSGSVWTREQAQRAVAVAQGVHGVETVVNRMDVEDEGLPRFSGPEGSAAQMLQLYRRLQPVLQDLDEGGIESMKLSGRGSWRVVLDGGAAIELFGRLLSLQLTNFKMLPARRRSPRSARSPSGASRRRSW